MWRELAKVTARTALYLLQKVSRVQERFLRTGKRQALSGELSAGKAPFSLHEDFGENPSENRVQAHAGQGGTCAQPARIHKWQIVAGQSESLLCGDGWCGGWRKSSVYLPWLLQGLLHGTPAAKLVRHGLEKWTTRWVRCWPYHKALRVVISCIKSN